MRRYVWLSRIRSDVKGCHRKARLLVSTSHMRVAFLGLTFISTRNG